MTRLTTARDIRATPAAIWERLADLARIVDWAPNIDHSCLISEQPDGVGAMRRVQAGPFTGVERVSTWETDLMLSYTIEGFPPAVTRVQNTWLLRPVEPITTSVSLITDIETTSSLRGRVIGKVVARQLDRASLAMLDGLAASVEEAS